MLLLLQVQPRQSPAHRHYSSVSDSSSLRVSVARQSRSMSNNKRKDIVETPSIDNETHKPKATWDPKTTEHFIQAYLDQVYKGEHNTTTLTKKWWKVVMSQFNERSGKQYGKIQLRHKWDNLKKEWGLWYKLFAKETGLGWDNEKNTVDAPDEWWEKKQSENRDYGKFRYKGLHFAHELTILFKNVMATGKFAWAPTSGILPNGTNEDDDGYRPCFESVVDREEGSRSSEESLDASASAGVRTSVRVSVEFRHMNLSTSQGNNSQNDNRKRNMARPSEMSERKRKAKIPASRTIADAISRIASASELCSVVVKALIVPSSSIGEVMAELQNMEVITSDVDCHFRCCQLIMFRPARKMFVSLKRFQERLLNWLKYAAYNPLPFMQN